MSSSTTPTRNWKLSSRLRYPVKRHIQLANVDLVWCRDVLVHVAALDRAYAEFRRILRESGRVLVYQSSLVGLQVDECIDVGIEWAEWSEEETGKKSRQLLHAARLLRAPERYVAQFGQAAYDIMLADCLWHVYHMIGKLGGRVYLLSRH